MGLYTFFKSLYNIVIIYRKGAEYMYTEDLMSDKEMMKVSVEEFSRLQRYMILADKESDTYKAMYERYVELKVILTSFGVNLTELDRVKQ